MCIYIAYIYEKLGLKPRISLRHSPCPVGLVGGSHCAVAASIGMSQGVDDSAVIRDKDLYATTNKRLQCLLKIVYTVF